MVKCIFVRRWELACRNCTTLLCCTERLVTIRAKLKEVIHIAECDSLCFTEAAQVLADVIID